MYNAKPGSPSRTYLRRGRCFASARRQTSRQTAAYPSLPVPGHNVGRAFTPAAAALRHHTAPQTAACVDLQYAPAAPRLSRHTRFRPPPPPQTSKASPARGGAAAGGGGVPHLALPIPFRLAAHAPPRQTSRQTAAYPSLPVPGHNVGRAFTPAAAALRHHTAPQTAACVDLQYAPAAPRLSRHTRFRPPPPPQTSKASPARGGAAAGGGGVPHLAPPIPFRVAAFPRHRTPCTDPRRFATCLPLPRRKTKTAARLFAGPRSPRVFFHCLRRRARMVRRGLPCYASPPSSRRINGTTSLGWMSSTSANSVYSIFSASRIAASSKPESRLPTACRFFLKS